MKRVLKIFSTVVLLFVFSSVVIAQNDKGINNRTFHFSYDWPGWNVDVYCGSTYVDHLVGFASVEAMYIIMKQGDEYKGHYIMRGTAQSITSGEVFKVHEVDKEVPGEAFYATINLVGANGTHYVMKAVFDPFSGVMTGVEKAVCPGN
jgi:hypothetical protein